MVKFRLLSIILLPTVFISCSKKQNSSVLTDAKMMTDSISIYDSIVLRHANSDFEIAKKAAVRCKIVADHLNTSETKIRALNTSGNLYSLSGSDSAFFYYSNALILSDNSANKYLRDRLIYNLAMLYIKAKEFKKGIIFLDSAFHLSSLNNPKLASTCLNSLGSVYFDKGDRVLSKKYFDSAYSIANSENLYREMGIALGNIARFQKDNEKLFKLTYDAIKLLDRVKGNEIPIAQLLINLGLSSSNQDSAIFYYKKALLIGGQYSEIIIPANNNLAYAYFEKKDFESAENCISKVALPKALEKNNYDWINTLYDTYSDILKAKGEISNALDKQKEAYLSLQDAHEKSASDQVRLLGAIFDSKNKENEIVKNKMLVTKQRGIIVKIVIIAFGLILSIIIIFIIYELRRKVSYHKQKLLSAKHLIDLEEKEKTKLARNLHDLVGHKFQNIKYYCENSKIENEIQETLLYMMEELQEDVRNISHRLKHKSLDHFSLEEAIMGLCDDCKNIAQVDLHLVIPQQLPIVKEEIKLHLYRIAEEILTNYMKYARTSRAIIHLQTNKNYLNFKYVDNGPGFDAERKNIAGIGLDNVKERVEILNAKFNLETRPDVGTSYVIDIPLS